MASAITPGLQTQSGSDPAAGTAVFSTAICPPGTTMLGGGGTVSTNSDDKGAVAMLESYPSAPGVWLARGVVLGSSGNPLGSGKKLFVQAYAVCTA